MTKPTELLDTAGVVKLLGVSVRTVHRMTHDGRLTPVFKGDSKTATYLFARADVEALVEQQQAAS